MREPMLTHLVDYLRRTGDRELLDLALSRAMKGLKNDGDSIDGIAMHFGLSTRSVYRRVGIEDDIGPARLAVLIKFCRRPRRVVELTRMVKGRRHALRAWLELLVKEGHLAKTFAKDRRWAWVAVDTESSLEDLLAALQQERQSLPEPSLETIYAYAEGRLEPVLVKKMELIMQLRPEIRGTVEAIRNIEPARPVPMFVRIPTQRAPHETPPTDVDRE